MTGSPTVRFSVIIPTHQRREVVLETVLALERQEFEDFETLVVVDGSTDGTAGALRELRTSRPLRVIEQENAGAAAARNAGAAAARGELLLLLDDDMEPDPGLLRVHHRAHRSGADVVLGHLPLHPASPRNALSAGVERWTEDRRRRLVAARGEVPLDDILTGQISLAREAFERVGGFDSSFTRDGLFGGEDIDFGHRLVQAGYRVVFVEEAISFQRYVVDPATYLRRSREAGRAAAELIAKHPDRESQLGRRTRLPPGPRRYPMGALVLAPRALSAPLRAAASALVRRGRRGTITKELFFALRRVEYVRGARAAKQTLVRSRVLVLAYHAIADLSRDAVLAEYGVPPETFARQLDALTARGHRFITLGRLLEALGGGSPLPERSVLLTFDDAYADLLTTALPMLEARGIPAVVFAVSGRTGGTNTWDHEIGADSLELLDADGLRAVQAAGIEVGAHSVSHRPLPPLPQGDLEAELRGAADQLEAAGLSRPRSFSYPYGECDERVAAAVRTAGYAVAFTVTPGVVERGVDRYALPRVEVFASDDGWRLALKLAAAGWPPRVRRAAARLVRPLGWAERRIPLPNRPAVRP